MNEVATSAGKQLVTDLLQQGMVGTLAIIAMAAACFFYWEKQKVEKRERALYESTHKRIEELLQDHAAKAEGWIGMQDEHLADLRPALKTALAKLSKNRDRNRS